MRPDDAPYTLSQLEATERTELFEKLAERDPSAAANLLETLPDAQGTEILSNLAPPSAARIVEQMDSDVSVDMLDGLEQADAENILAELDTEQSADVRRLLEHPKNVAGGLMITEFLAYSTERSVTDVIEDLRRNGAAYREYEVRYIYALDEQRRFAGHVSVRELLLSPHGRRLNDVGTKHVSTVRVDMPIDALENLLDRAEHVALPVIDEEGRMCGVVTRAAVQEALKEQRAEDLLKFGGIIGGEELRTMPTMQRSVRRLAFLLPNVLLSYLAVSVIAMYESLIARLTALAVVLPMVANLTGAAGNQAVAVSIRELTLNVVKPKDVLRVWRREVLLGLTNGAVLGAILAALTAVTRGDNHIAVTVGCACVVASLVAVLLGSALPLLLKRLGVDPAMLSSPILTTLTDMTSFFLTLHFAVLLFGSGL
ncbi:MAG TPA: magnesium transporter [Polyangiaceae bacterium]|nr:magnesium transporter [Polyangiaceae bacterium]